MRITRRRLLASAASLCAISGCLDSASDDGRPLPTTPTGTWNQSGSDAQQTHSADVAVPDRGTPAWSGGSGLVTPLVVDETVYTVDDALTALDAQTGERQWQTDLGIDQSPNSATQPAVSGDHLVLASDGRLAAYDTTDGTERWKRDITGLPDEPITVATDRRLGFAFFGRPEESELPSELVAFGVESGETEWTSPLRAISSAPAVVGDYVYVTGWTGPETHVLRCLSVDGGEPVWERELDDPKTPPVGTETGVLVGAGAEITVYDHAGGERLTAVAIPHEQIRALAIDDGTAFVLAESGLSAVTIPTGDEQWSLSGQEDYAQADGLAVGRDTVVAPVFPDALDTSPAIAAFDRSDGRRRWQYAIDDAFSPTIAAPPVLADGAVFVMSNTKTGVTALGDLPPQKEDTTAS